MVCAREIISPNRLSQSGRLRDSFGLRRSASRANADVPIRGVVMSKLDYLDPRWQKFRLERLQAANWECDSCSAANSTLHVHHSFYISGRFPWDYLPETTVVLCDDCHGCQHDFTGSGRPSHFGFENWEYEAARSIREEFEHAKSTFTKA